MVTVSKIEGGSTFNVIPTDVKLTGTMRAASSKHLAFLKQRLIEVSQGAAIAYGCEANRFQFMADPFPASINDVDVWEWLRKILTNKI